MPNKVDLNKGVAEGRKITAMDRIKDTWNRVMRGEIYESEEQKKRRKKKEQAAKAVEAYGSEEE